MKVNMLSDKPAGALTGAGKVVDRSQTAATATASKPAASAAPSNEASVTVSLSPATQSLASTATQTSVDVFNTKKVEAVRQAIENGSFSINADAIADKLLSSARDMLSVAAK